MARITGLTFTYLKVTKGFHLNVKFHLKVEFGMKVSSLTKFAMALAMTIMFLLLIGSSPFT